EHTPRKRRRSAAPEERCSVIPALLHRSAQNPTAAKRRSSSPLDAVIRLGKSKLKSAIPISLLPKVAVVRKILQHGSPHRQLTHSTPRLVQHPPLSSETARV